MPIIAPSFLSADFLNLQKDCDLINNSSADWVHLDVMDGRFVPNISFGLPVIEAVKRGVNKTLDVHLMIEEPERYAEDFRKAGADILTVHYEACRHLHRNIQQIKSLGMKAGVALNPHTSVHVLDTILTDVDMVLLMSVNPGFGGQKFIPQTIDKIRALKHMIKEAGADVLIEIDGGVTLENAPAILHTGADVLVAGNTVFRSADPYQTIDLLKSM